MQLIPQDTKLVNVCNMTFDIYHTQSHTLFMRGVSKMYFDM